VEPAVGGSFAPAGPYLAGCRNGLLAKRSDDDISGFGAAVILLPGDEVAVTDCEAPPQTSLDVVGPELFISSSMRHGMTWVPLGSAPADQTASSTKSSSMLVKPVTVRPFTSGSPLDKVLFALDLRIARTPAVLSASVRSMLGGRWRPDLGIMQAEG